MSGHPNPFDNQMDRHTYMNHKCSRIDQDTLERHLLLPVGIHPYLPTVKQICTLNYILPDNYNQNISTEMYTVLATSVNAFKRN